MFPLETGGILLGVRHSPTVFVVAAVVGPGPSATHNKTSFEPDQEWQVEQVASRWAESDGTLEYLGDWHSHPNGSPRASRDDVRAVELIRNAHEARAPNPLMLILGVSYEGNIEARAHVLLKRRMSLGRIVLIA